ncbi:hypothetical protein GF326_07570 [Candidatus Bathyarchaeota archaeon]|nr:hypothetical protein [Candidatus Bathyarchaeota archaeon]
MSIKRELIEEVKKQLTQKNGLPIIIASQRGKTALKIAEEIESASNVIAISEFEYTKTNKKGMKKVNVKTLENANLPIQDLREMRETLLMFDSGIKAALEVASIAYQNELVNGEYIVIAGSEKGLDTALLVNTLHPNSEAISDPLKKIKVEKILASPLIS